jgi:integrase
MPVLKITHKEVQHHLNYVQLMQGASEKPKDVFLYDTQLQGFGCKVTAGGKASWFVEKRFGGTKNIRKKIGAYPAMSIDHARQQGQIVLGEIAKGTDVSKEKRDSRSAQQATLKAKTVAQLWEEYHRRRNQGTKHHTDQNKLFDRVVEPVIGDLPPKQITKQQLREMLDSQSPGMQYQLYALLSVFIKDLIEREQLVISPLAGIRRPKCCEERRRIMSESEIRAYWDAATRMGYPVGHYYKFMLLTGQRRNETRISEWSEIQGDVWNLPPDHTKNGLPHTVHLSEQAQALLGECWKSAKWLFTEFGTGPIGSAGDVWALLLALMVNPGMGAAEIRAKPKTYQGIVSMYQGPELRLHDVRRSMASTMVNSLGVAPHVVHKILNHEQRDPLDKSYLQYQLLPERRDAQEKWGSYVRQLVGGA